MSCGSSKSGEEEPKVSGPRSALLLQFKSRRTALKSIDTLVIGPQTAKNLGMRLLNWVLAMECLRAELDLDSQKPLEPTLRCSFKCQIG